MRIFFIFFRFSLSVIFLLLLLIVPVSAAELSLNGGFEAGNTSNWTISNPNSHGSISVSGSYKYSGVYGCKVQNAGTGSETTSISQTFNFTNVQSISWWSRFNVTRAYGSGTGFVNVSISGVGSIWGNASGSTVGQNWTYHVWDNTGVTGTRTVTFSARGYVGPMFDDPTNSVIPALIVDDFSVQSYESVPLDYPIADFIMYPDTGYAPLQVSFTDISINADSWFWDFGDGGTSILKNPVNNFSEGNYTVSLTVYNENGSSTQYQGLQVLNEGSDPGLFGWLVDWLRLIYNSIVDGFKNIRGNINNVTNDTGNNIFNSTNSILGSLSGGFGNITNGLDAGFTNVVSGLGNSSNAVNEKIDTVSSSVNGVYDFLTNTSDFSTEYAENTESYLIIGGSIQGLNNSFTSFANYFINPVANMSEGLNSASGSLNSNDQNVSDAVTLGNTISPFSSLPSEIVWLGNIMISLMIIGYVLRAKS